MTHSTHQPESTAAVLYMACELGAAEWWLTMSVAPDAKRLRRKVAAGDQAAVQAALTAARARFGVPADAPVRSCYEAGRDGFWPHRCLTALGVTNLVVDSSSIELPRRPRRAKTDRLDGEKLLRLLLRHWGGEREMWHVVHVPSPAVEDARHSSRGGTTLARERTRYRNRIHSLLALHGVRLRIDAQFPARVAAATDWAGVPLPAGVLARVRESWELLHGVEALLKQARRAERARTRRPATGTLTAAQKLRQLHAIGPRSAAVLADELLSRSLRNRRQVGALTGLVSAPFYSGDRRVDQGLAPSGLPAVRRIAVELAWLWLRYQPDSALSQWYERRFGRGGAVARRIGIVALARRVVIALWRYVTHDVLPEGAQLRTV